MTPTAAVLREMRDLTARRRRLGLTVHQLAHIARLRNGRVCRPDGDAVLKLSWVLWALEDGWSLHQVRAQIEYFRRTGSVPAAGGVVERGPAEGGGGRRVGEHS